MTGSTDPIDVLGLTSRVFCRVAASRGLARPDEALDVYRAVFREGRAPVPWVSLPKMPVGAVHREGDTTKFTLCVGDDRAVETVILPQRSRTGRLRNTLCVSSQIGCAMGCTFCETARMGLKGQLTASQIIGQWHHARFAFAAHIDNVVFMGMGEPMDNLDAVIPAIQVLADHNGPAVPASQISVSTVGHARGIERLAELARTDGFRQLRLAVSLNAPDDRVRTSLMPINRAVPMARLREAIAKWPATANRPVLVEYVLIPGVNDGSSHAARLCRFLEPLHATVNVIPYNPRRESPWPAPRDEDVDRFVDAIRLEGRFVTRRQTMGRSVMAACGQLGSSA